MGGAREAQGGRVSAGSPGVMVERRIRAARFSAVKSLDSFDFPAIPRDERRLLNLQRQLPRLKLLIIDELGFVPLSPTGALDCSSRSSASATSEAPSW